MKTTAIAVLVFLSATPAISMGISTNSLTPSLWFPEPQPAPTQDVVSKNALAETK